MAAHGAVAFGQKVVIFGGMIKDGASDTTYVLDTGTCAKPISKYFQKETV